MKRQVRLIAKSPFISFLHLFIVFTLRSWQRRKPTLEPTIDEWQGVDNLDLCLSSSQRWVARNGNTAVRYTCVSTPDIPLVSGAGVRRLNIIVCTTVLHSKKDTKCPHGGAIEELGAQCLLGWFWHP